MVLTPSVMVDLGTTAPDFTLTDMISGEEVSFQDIAGPIGTVVVFMCNHCPFVLHVMEELVNIADEYSDEGIFFVGINSNDAEAYPDDAPEKMADFAEEYDMTFPYLYDESQEVAKDYDAACTPDIFVYDTDDQLVYRGQMDSSRPQSGKPVNGSDLRAALDALVAGQPVAEKQIPSSGCNIKWRE